jgi:hypothetical protein
VVYRHPWHEGLTLGYCARADPPDEWADLNESAADVAFFCISEPLGATVSDLRFDEQGVGWFGYLKDGLPQRPQAR